MTGKQIAGRQKRTSEVLLHLEIYKQNPEVRSVVHCHPPYATAFSGGRRTDSHLRATGVRSVPRSRAHDRLRDAGGPRALPTRSRRSSRPAKIAVLKNHGTVAWAETVDRAYWWTEILDAYCRILLIAKQVGNVERISEPKIKELLDLKEQFGITPATPRRMQNADLCINTEFGRGFCRLVELRLQQRR